MAMVGTRRSARSVRPPERPTTSASGVSSFTSTAAVSVSPVSTADGSKHGFMTREFGMDNGLGLELSEAHAHWLEAERKIPPRLAAQMGVVTRGRYPAFSYFRT